MKDNHNIAEKVAFVYSSWQRMFACNFSDDKDGLFVLLVRENQYLLNKCNSFSFHQRSDEDGSANPYDTTICAQLKDIKLDGEMVVACLDIQPKISAVIKLPCGATRCPWKEGTWMDMTGELQFQIKPQLSTTHAESTSLKHADIISTIDNGVDQIISIAGNYFKKGLHGNE